MNALLKIAGSKTEAAKRIAKSTAKGLAAGAGLGGVGAAVGGQEAAYGAGHEQAKRIAGEVGPQVRGLMKHAPLPASFGIPGLNTIPEDVRHGLREGVPYGAGAAAALGGAAGLARGIRGEMKRRKKAQPKGK
jgi:hypothetical protein